MIKKISIFLLICIVNLSLLEGSFAITALDVQVKHSNNEAIIMEIPASVMADDDFVVRVNEPAFKEVTFAHGITKLDERSENGFKTFLLKAPHDHGEYSINIAAKDGKIYTNKVEVRSYLNEFLYGSAKVTCIMVFGVAVIVATLNYLFPH
jgi:hypothetical protein